MQIFFENNLKNFFRLSYTILNVTTKNKVTKTSKLFNNCNIYNKYVSLLKNLQQNSNEFTNT